MGNIGQILCASKAKVLSGSPNQLPKNLHQEISEQMQLHWFIETEMTAQLSAEVVENYAKAIPLQKWANLSTLQTLCIPCIR